MAIGVAAGVACYAAVTWLKALLGYDDALDCFGVHAVGGATGAILTGVFAIKEYGGTAGLIEGNAHQVVNQLIGVGIVAAYDAIVSLLILKIIDSRLGLRVKREVEIEGLDLTLHGEAVQ
jgi:Amt family ammonium transporter